MTFDIYIPENLAFSDYIAVIQVARTWADAQDRKVSQDTFPFQTIETDTYCLPGPRKIPRHRSTPSHHRLQPSHPCMEKQSLHGRRICRGMAGPRPGRAARSGNAAPAGNAIHQERHAG